MEQATLTLRFAPELRFFLPPRHRGTPVRVEHDRTSSLGHVVESLGVPLTEVGALRLGDQRVTPSYRPRPGELVDVAPVERPQRPPFSPVRFLLDVHLGTLARRLRLLGVDTAYDNDRDDEALVRQANDERRVLLTRDRRLLYRRSLRAGGHVRGDRPEQQLRDVLDRFAPPLHPWTRCPACNGLLSPVAKSDVADELAAGTLATYDTFARCGVCSRVYWSGAHYRRLAQIVREAREYVSSR